MKTLRLTTLAVLVAAVSIAPLQAADETVLIAAVAEDGVTLYAKAMACDELGKIGTAKAVPALSKLLADERLNDYARDALERINDPAAGEALLDGLSWLKGSLRIGVIISLGDRGDAAAVPALAEIAKKKGEDENAAAAALNSLAQIANEDANKAILSVLADGDQVAKTAAGHAALAAAQRLEKAGKKERAAKLRSAAQAAGVPAPVKKVAKR